MALVAGELSARAEALEAAQGKSRRLSAHDADIASGQREV